MGRARLFVAALLFVGCGRADPDPTAPPADDASMNDPAPSSDGDDPTPAPSSTRDASTDAPADAEPPGPPTSFRIMSFNIKNGEVADHDIAKLTAPLLPSDPDVLALQEVDQGTKRSGNLLEASEVAKAMSMPYSTFGKAFDYDGGAYGVALVSKLPLVDPRVIRLDDHTVRAEGYEPRIALAADIVFGAWKVTVVSMHASLKAEERPINATRLLAALGTTAARALVMGDFNETPGGAIGTALVGAGFVDAYHEKHPTLGFTAPATPFPIRRIDFLFKGSAFGPTVHAWVPDVTTSDHRPVAAVVTLPK